MGMTILIFLIFISFSAQSATVTWDGEAGDHLWTNGSNWDTDIVPNIFDDVIINGNTGFIGLTDEVFCKSLTILSTSELILFPGGAIEVDGSSDIGIVLNSNATLTNEGFITIQNAQGSGLVSSSAIIENSGTISIQNVNLSGVASKYGIDASGGTITNSSDGEIMITAVNGVGATQYGLRLVSSAVLNNFGDIDISNSDSGGITSTSEINNFGNILMNSIGDRGMSSTGDLNNEVSGRIDLTDIGDIGIFSFLGMFNNFGEVNIANTVASAFVCNSTFINSGSISLFNGDSHGIFVGGSNTVFTNLGQIDIDQYDSDGIKNMESFINEGKIVIKNVLGNGIDNFGTLQIKDSMTIDNAVARGFFNRDSLVIYQDVPISIFQCGASLNTMDLVNNGFMELNECLGDCLTNYGKLINNNSINIANSGGRGLENGSELYNSTGASITIKENFNQVAVYNLLGIIENKGLLEVSDSSVGLLNNAMFINEDSLLIYRSESAGIRNSDTIIHKAGAVIEIDGVSDLVGSSGLSNSSIGTYLVVDGVISISNVVYIGISNQGKIVSGATGLISTTNIGFDPLQIINGSEFIINSVVDIGN